MTKKPRKPEKFVRTPGYPGGRKALGEFIKSELKYPEQALANKIEGKVTVQFVLNQDGKVKEAAVLRGLGYGCDEEALRIINLLKFKGVKNRGVRATFKKTLSIPFSLAKKKPSPNIQINYSFKEDDSSKKSITYSIKIDKQLPFSS